VPAVSHSKLRIKYGGRAHDVGDLAERLVF
jgi:hypothetical protein